MSPIRVILAAATIAALGAVMAPSAHAQGAAATAPAAANPKLAGVWEGNYTTDGPSGVMTLTLAKDGVTWKVTNSLGGEAPPAGEVKEVTANGNAFSWRQMIGEYDVTFKATLSDDGTKLTGSLEAQQGGAVVGGGNFTLSRKP